MTNKTKQKRQQKYKIKTIHKMVNRTNKKT